MYKQVQTERPGTYKHVLHQKYRVSNKTRPGPVRTRQVQSEPAHSAAQHTSFCLFKLRLTVKLAE